MWEDGDVYRSLNPDKSVYGRKEQFGVYSIKLKQKLLDSLNLDVENNEVNISLESTL